MELIRKKCGMVFCDLYVAWEDHAVETPSDELLASIGWLRIGDMYVCPRHTKETLMSHSDNDNLTVTPISEEIKNRFGFHKATIEGPNATAPKHAELRRAFIDFAIYLDSVMSDPRTSRMAFERLEEASMWAHKAIANEAPLEQEEGSSRIDPVQPKCSRGPLACNGHLTRFLTKQHTRDSVIWFCQAHIPRVTYSR